jgi:hypothetical protein
MGFPDLQDGRPPRDSAGAELASGPVPAETPDEDTTGYRPPAPGTGVAAPRANGTAGSRPAGRSGAHRRSVAGPQRQPWPAAPTVTGARDRSQPPSRGGTGPQDQLQPPSRAVAGPQDQSWLSSPPGGGRGLPAAPPVTGPPATGPQARHGRRPGPAADGLDEDGRLAITREAPTTRRGTAPQAGPDRTGARRGPLRGFPPPPGQPGPVYPPGQFSPWNRASTRAAWLGIARAGGGAAEADPGYSALAVSDAAADLTSTQTWAAIGDEPPANPSFPVRAGNQGTSHTGELPRQRAAGGRAPAGRARGGRTPGPRGPAGAATGPQRLAGGPTGPQGLAGAPTGPQALAGAATGPQGLAGPATGPQEPATLGGAGAPARAAPADRTAGRQAAADRASTARPAPSAFGEAERGRPSRAVAGGVLAAEGEEEPEGRRAGKRGGRSTAMMAAMLLAPVLVVLVVVGGYVYLSGKHSPAPARPAAPSHPTAAPSSSPSPTLGPWKHIESRSQDPVPLTVSQLFPARFARDGAAGTLAVSKSGTRCSREVFGSKLAAAIRKAKCTQVLRASYLSTDRKIMATVGVLNLNNVTGAEKAGKAAGATQFIKQLPSRHGPTRNIAKGTGIEVAEVKGHYLILIWTEFANLHAPKGKTQRTKLESFSQGLVAGTANVSLSNRMVTGRP